MIYKKNHVRTYRTVHFTYIADKKNDGERGGRNEFAVPAESGRNMSGYSAGEKQGDSSRWALAVFNVPVSREQEW